MALICLNSLHLNVTLLMLLGCASPIFSSANSGIIDVTLSPFAGPCIIGVAVPAPYTRVQVVCTGNIPGVGSQVYNYFTICDMITWYQLHARDIYALVVQSLVNLSFRSEPDGRNQQVK